MTNKLIRPVTKQYIPGVVAIAPRPARCYTRTIPRQTSGSVASYQFIALDSSAPNTSQGYSGFLRPVYRTVEPYVGEFGNLVTQELVGWTAIRFAPSDPVYTSRTETVCTDAVAGRAGTPSQLIVQNAGPDWRASSRGIATQSGGATATFTVNPSPRSIVGFATQDTGSNQSDVRMGVAFVTTGLTTSVRPVLDGVVQASVGAFTAGGRVTLTRVSGRFYIGLAGATVYMADATTEEDVFLDAMLYTSSDFVDNPTLGPTESTSVSGGLGFKAGLGTTTGTRGSIGFASAIGTAVSGVILVPVTGDFGFTAASVGVLTTRVSVAGAVGFAGSIRSGAYSFGADPSLGLGTSELSGSTLTIERLVVRGSNYAYSYGEPDLKPLLIDAAGGELSQSVDGGDLVLAPMLSYSTMLTGGLVESALALKPLVMLAADAAYGGGGLTLPSLTVYGDDGFGIPNYYGHNEGLELSSDIFTDPSLFASIYETLELGLELSLATLVSGTVFEGLILDPSITAADFLSALIESGINLSSATQMPDPSVAQYAFNALSGAATRYSDFGFTQFTRVGGATYAVKPDGLYRLRPGDDDGQKRSALVDFGAMAFGAQQRKNIETMYLGMTTDGTVYAKLKADGGDEKIYHVIQREPTMRVRTGKGLTAREWSLKLEVVDATRVDLDTVDFVVGASVRRWTR